ncbi:MAG: heavy-metal-associated domain-containing protein [Rhodovarius sp.]|nr:heavy-metal-associated domain-containing protein [Rhodovarius sp.]
MTDITLTLPDMVCGGCAQAVTRAVQRLDPAARVEADPPTRSVRIATRLGEPELREALARAGFPATENAVREAR